MGLGLGFSEATVEGCAPRVGAPCCAASQSGSPPHSAGKLGVERISEVVIVEVAVLDVAPQELVQVRGRQQVLVAVLHHRRLLQTTNNHISYSNSQTTSRAPAASTNKAPVKARRPQHGLRHSLR